MAVSYKKLWKILIDRDMKKRDLEKIANISTYTIGKLNKNKNVNVQTLARICCALGCKIDDIVDVIPDDEEDAKV